MPLNRRSSSSATSHLLIATTSARPSCRTLSAIFRSCDLEPARAVEQQHDHLGEIDRAAGIGDRQLLELVVDLGLLAHAGGVDQPHRAVLPSGAFHSQSTAIESRVIPASGPVISRSSLEHAVDQGRFARIGPADDGELQRRIAPRLLVLFGLVALDMRAQMLEQVDHALAMLGAHRDRLAEAERPGLQYAGLAGFALGLVGGEDDRRRLRRAASGRSPRPAESRRRGRRSGTGRRRHRGPPRVVCARIRPGRRLGILVLIAGGVDHPEFEAEQAAPRPRAGRGSRPAGRRRAPASCPTSRLNSVDLPTLGGRRWRRWAAWA